MFEVKGPKDVINVLMLHSTELPSKIFVFPFVVFPSLTFKKLNSPLLPTSSTLYKLPKNQRGRGLPNKSLLNSSYPSPSTPLNHIIFVINFLLRYSVLCIQLFLKRIFFRYLYHLWTEKENHDKIIWLRIWKLSNFKWYKETQITTFYKVTYISLHLIFANCKKIHKTQKIFNQSWSKLE